MKALLLSPWLDRLGWALLHSIWEGTLVVLAAALALRLLRGRSPRLRCALAVLALLGSMLLPLRRVVAPSAPSAVQTGTAEGLRGVRAPSFQGMPLSVPSARTRVERNLERALPWIVTAWGAGALFCLLRLAGGWAWLQGLRWRKAELAPDPLQSRLLDLCRRAGLKRAVTLLTCEDLAGPSVVGFLWPAILVPAGWFLNLPADQVEALLAHELAHVLRHDYAVNLLQSLVEVLMFYHPGVRWLSARIRAERELACDAYAARLTGDSLPLAEALAFLETRAHPHVPHELAPAAHGGSLMERIRQLLSPQPRTSSTPLAGVLILGFVLLSLPSSGHARMVPPTPTPTPTPTPAPVPLQKVQGNRPEPPRVRPLAEPKPMDSMPSQPGEPLAVLVRKNRVDEQGQCIPHEWVVDIRAKGAPLLQIWDAFEDLMKADAGPRGEIRRSVYRVDPKAGPALVTIDLREATPAAVVRTFENIFGGPRRTPPGDPTGLHP